MTHSSRARVSPPDLGDDFPEPHMEHPIDAAWREGEQRGFDLGFSRGVVLTLCFVLAAWMLAALVGVA